jgi:hypothetical protein
LELKKRKRKKEMHLYNNIYYIREGAPGATDSCCNGIDGATG